MLGAKGFEYIEIYYFWLLALYFFFLLEAGVPVVCILKGRSNLPSFSSLSAG